MNKKKPQGRLKTVIIGIAVASVWGLIFYRVFDAMHDGTNDTVNMPTVLKQEASNDYTITEDTVHPSLNYRNPFDSKKKDSLVTQNKKAVHHALIAAAKAAKSAPIDILTYNGYIRNAATKRLIAMLRLNGRVMMLAEGESAGAVTLLKNMRNSILITYERKNRILPLKTHNQ